MEEGTSELSEVEQALAVVRGQNVELLGQLRALGAQPNPVQIMQQQIDTLLETFFDENAQNVFKLNFETRMNHLLTEGVKSARRSKIMTPGTPGFGIH